MYVVDGNVEMQISAAASAGISQETFISIHDTAAVGVNLSAFSDSRLNAACQVLADLSAYQSVLADYNTIYNNLGCDSRLVSPVAAGRGVLSSTGIAVLFLAASGIGFVGVTLIERS